MLVLHEDPRIAQNCGCERQVKRGGTCRRVSAWSKGCAPWPQVFSQRGLPGKSSRITMTEDLEDDSRKQDQASLVA